MSESDTIFDLCYLLMAKIDEGHHLRTITGELIDNIPDLLKADRFGRLFPPPQTIYPGPPQIKVFDTDLAYPLSNAADFERGFSFEKTWKNPGMPDT